MDLFNFEYKKNIDHFVEVNKKVLRFNDAGLWGLLVRKSIKISDHFVEVNKKV